MVIELKPQLERRLAIKRKRVVCNSKRTFRKFSNDLLSMTPQSNLHHQSL
jgi:hypothetical protein